MDLTDRHIALFGKCSAGVFTHFSGQIQERGGRVVRDITRRTDTFVVGGLAIWLISSGALARRLSVAQERDVRVLGEGSFAAALTDSEAPTRPTMPLGDALDRSGLSREDASLLAAFDLVRIERGRCDRGDVESMSELARLISVGNSRTGALNAMKRGRDRRPRGPFSQTAGESAALLWRSEGYDGGGALSSTYDGISPIEDWFQAAALAEAEGRRDEAAQHYLVCSRIDPWEPTAPYNHGRLLLEEKAYEAAASAFRSALVRDVSFVETRFELAMVLEQRGDVVAAEAELRRVVALDPTYADAVFRLAQLLMNNGDLTEANPLLERFLALEPTGSRASLAQRMLGKLPGG